jgi:hypothetical protein
VIFFVARPALGYAVFVYPLKEYMNMISEENAAAVMEKAVSRIEEIFRAALRIEDAVNRMAAEGKTPAGMAAAGAPESLSREITAIRNLQNENAMVLRAVRDDVEKLLASRSGSFTEMLGPDGLR